MMGSPGNEEGRTILEDLHQVTLTKGFWLGETTVTQALWQAVMDESPSRFKGDDRPVENVSWNDCQKFIEALNQVHPDLQLRLPWETEWEYACRAGTGTPFSFGGKDDLILEKVNYSNKWNESDSNGKTKPVKSYPANDWGLYEMHGNTWEWCQDIWREHLGATDVINSEGQSVSKEAYRVIRGGSWVNFGGLCRSAVRFGYGPSDHDGSIGFRLALGH